jgi:hypothetical protein
MKKKFEKRARTLERVPVSLLAQAWALEVNNIPFCVHIHICVGGCSLQYASVKSP